MQGFSHRTKYGAIIDVHSGSVGIAIVDLRNHDLPHILFAHREYLRINESVDDDSKLRLMKNALFAASLEYSQTGLTTLREHDSRGRVDEILFVCGAPWTTTATRFTKIEEETPFVITEERIRSLIEEAERADEAEHAVRDQFKEQGLVILERSVIHTMVNGYLMADPYGKKATELSLAHISGLAPKALDQVVAEIEDKTMPHAQRTSHTFALVLFCVIRDLYPDTPQGILIDISGEATEVIIMQDEVLRESLVVPYGTHTFLRDVAHTLGTFPDEALGHLREFGDATPDNIKRAIVEARDAYISKLEAVFADFKTRFVLPHHIFLSTSKNLDGFFLTIVDSATATHRGQHGTLVSLNTTLKAADGVDEKQPYDAFFGVESRFFHKRHGCGEIDA